MFARYLVEDMRLPEHPFIREVAEQIKKQIEDAHVALGYREHLEDVPSSVNNDEDVAWWQSRKRRRLESPVPVEELIKTISIDNEMRMTIKVLLSLSQPDS